MKTRPLSFQQVSDLTEILFANRNKLYGAYELRKHYHDRLLKALILTASSTILGLLIISFSMRQNPVIADYFPPDMGSEKTFIIEKKSVRRTPTSPDRTIKENLPTVILNDTASERTERADSAIANQGDNPASMDDSISLPDGGQGQAMAVDSSSQVTCEQRTDRLFSEVMPSFPGGISAFSKYFQTNFDCGGNYISEEGKIVLRFVVMKDGSIAKVEVLRDNVGIDCVNEAKSILLNSPRWNPGLQNNQPVNVILVLPITVQVR